MKSILHCVNIHGAKPKLCSGWHQVCCVLVLEMNHTISVCRELHQPLTSSRLRRDLGLCAWPMEHQLSLKLRKDVAQGCSGVSTVVSVRRVS